MCLAIPVQITKIISDDSALVDVGGISKTICISLLSDVQVGDYVIMHVGYALNKVDEAEVEKTLAFFGQQASAPN